MNLVVIDGYLGAGKTLAMTLLSLYFQELSGCALYSNYGVKGSKEFTHYKDFLRIAEEKSTIVCLDEAHTDLDARNFNTNAVKFFTHLIFYLRKLRCTLMLATPSIENLDSRVRAIANLYIQVQKDKKYFRYYFYDMQSGRFLKKYKIKQQDAFVCASMAYDTYNMVLPVTFPEDRKEFHEFLPILKQKSNEYYLQGVQSGADRPPAGDAKLSHLDVQKVYASGDYSAVV
jgi:hypothetical protein